MADLTTHITVDSLADEQLRAGYNAMRYPETIRVVLFHEPEAIFVGRPTVLGNPWPMQSQRDVERDRVCDLYAEWLARMITERNRIVLAFLAKLQEAAMRQQGLKLGCYCAPRRCHADSIKAALERYPTGYFDLTGPG